MTAIVDLFPKQLRRGYRKEIFIACVCMVWYLIGLSMVTKVCFPFYSRTSMTSRKRPPIQCKLKSILTLDLLLILQERQNSSFNVTGDFSHEIFLRQLICLGQSRA